MRRSAGRWRFAFHDLKLVVEPGGAIGLAALISGKIDVKGKVTVAVLSGGNVDPELFHRLVCVEVGLWGRGLAWVFVFKPK